MLGFLPTRAYRPGTPGATTFLSPLSGTFNYGWDSFEFRGGRFRIRWVGQTAGDIFELVSTMMPEGDPGSLSPEDYANLLAYILRLNGYPAGEEPLPADVSALQNLRIEETPVR